MNSITVTVLILTAISISILALAVFILVKRKGKIPDSRKGETPLFSLDMGLKSKLSVLFGRSDLNGDFFSSLEEALVQADVGVETTSKLLKTVSRFGSTTEVRKSLSDEMGRMLPAYKESIVTVPHVILVVGVNGVGKTTTIAKLARYFVKQGKRVLLVAADTYRAAAGEQLSIWGERLSLDVVSQKSGADPAAVAFDGVEKGVAKKYDVVIIDTAGRLHTSGNLMEELRKISRVIGKACPGAPHEKLLVIDATVGSNGLLQAKQFHQTLELTGALIAKMDGTAKGGIVLSVGGELNIPVAYIGIGEDVDDLMPFDPEGFVKSIVE